MKGQRPELAARVGMQRRPAGSPIMYQSWGKLLFIHWEMPADVLKTRIPARLELDTFEGKAWVSLTPFTIWGNRLLYTPPIPWLSSFHELNLRTYVHSKGVPGVWFFSLDANSRLVVKGARAFFHLPYHTARISLEDKETATSHRIDGRESPRDWRRRGSGVKPFRLQSQVRLNSFWLSDIAYIV